jgi:hypothetical protein
MKTIYNYLILLIIIGLQINIATKAAEEGLCAVVKIEIKQELTLERQAFDAHMRISNGLTNLDLENLKINVTFADENGDPVHATSDPNDTTALFFINIDTMEGIDDIDGNGIIPASSSADIHWLIIPAPDSGGTVGTLYYIGATLEYTMGGEEHSTQVTPDYIFVKPQPLLTLDYFLPNEVYGDDAFTPEIEPPIPYTLGVRIKNDGHGIARQLKIESAQPRIVENELGLLIGFEIISSSVNNQPTNPSLLIDFGDIQAGKTAVGRWQMITTLSGEFTEFNADFTHADELGGELTSLIQATNTHFLEKDVLVDLPGRDEIRDFLAKDNDILRVYESHGLDTQVNDHSDDAMLQLQNQSLFKITAPVTAGFLYLKLPDPLAGTKAIKQIVRSDGKVLSLDNVWLSKSRRENNEWEYFIKLFDSNSTGQYQITLETATQGPQAPVLQFIPDRTTPENQQISFLVKASDPNGTIPTLSATNLPSGARFIVQNEGEAFFDWTPVKGQAGSYDITFTASDGTLETSQTARIIVYSNAEDSDGDGMPDSCEMQYFGNLERDGRSDFDNDGISDLEECLLGTDPTLKIPDILINEADIQATENTEFIELYDSGIGNTPLDGLIIALFDGELDQTYAAFDLDGFTTDADGYFVIGGSEIANADLTVPENNTVTVTTDEPAPLEGLKVYLFNAAGNYTGTYAVTDANGQAHFTDFEAGEYKFRIDYLEAHFWSENVNLPETTLIDVTIAHETLEIQIDTAANLEGIKVYLFSASNAYLGRYAVTDAEGKVSFYLPVGQTYTFRADILGGQYWSEPIEIVSGGINTATMAIGGGTLLVQLTDSPDQILEGVKVYLFNEAGTYLGLYKISDANGEVSFAVPPGTFKLRADYLGYQWWSEPVLVTTDTTVEIPIDQAPVSITVTGDGPMEGLKVYLFTPEGTYLGWYELTNETGQAIFNLPAQPYKVRVDYLGQQYWSAEFAGNDIDVIIPMGEVEITVLANNIGIEDVTVYIFNSTQTYLGVNAITDVNGIAAFTLPAGEYLFRADYQNSQYWSETATVIADNLNAFNINTGGSTFAFSVLSSETEGLAGVKCHVFDENGAYIGLNAITDETGLANFDLSDGIYQIRVDHLGYQFWSEMVNLPQVDTAELLIPHQTVTIDVLSEYQTPEPMVGVKVYLFSENGNYLNQYQFTDENGQVSFYLPEKEYKVRADYLDEQYWSDPFIWENTGILIQIGLSHITVIGGGNPLPNVKVYVFTPSGNYLGLNQTTSEEGIVEFILPQGEYKFRADYQGSQFWSEDSDISGGAVTDITIDTGGGTFAFTLLKEVNMPMANVKCYVFNESGTYLGLSANTNSQGRVEFDLSTGHYKIRIDYLGYQFWSPIYTLPETTAATLSIDHQDITINVMGEDFPLAGLKVYLFSSSGSYLGQTKYTDENGQVIFNLPDQSYKVRIDYLGGQYWSSDFQSEDISVVISHAQVTVHAIQNNEDVENARVYIFSGTGSYLGEYANTDSTGRVAFLLPIKDYKFRVDFGGSQYWSEVINVNDDIEIEVVMD